VKLENRRGKKKKCIMKMKEREKVKRSVDFGWGIYVEEVLIHIYEG
jgi:hypothetical protein